ncbi:efflux RND transporter periplasmic adaptor subunit [Paenisporosarcina sp. TG20]|uniref:HlyD family efflux transporter periplasmic adaptor subunit n=1 Tax=Paenisporosarcina sp. TG20 TaxID=1211706 RepID=UPI0003029E61|nr:efflux RND transporter periplasmic adaptor subunit [Paenisporosarcina sp. TG20]
MNKWVTIGIAIVISAFLATNAILLFSDKSIISKRVYTNDYEMVATADYEEKLPKESLVAPLSVSTVYVESEDAIKDWLVKEGDVVTAGQELATLNTSTADQQRNLWESELEALESQLTETNRTISSLRSDRANADNSNNSNENVTDNVNEDIEEQTVNVDINVNVGLDVEVQQDGFYALAISQAEQKQSEINQQIAVVEAQLAQEGTVAILSPVEGFVSAIRDENDRLAIEIYSTERIVVTYATDEQWQVVQVNDRVRIQADGKDQSIEGVVTSISQVPATTSDFLTAYKALDPKESINPLAYYEVRIQPNESIDQLPFGNNTNAMVIVNEAQQAVSVRTAWLYNRAEQSAVAYMLNPQGHAVKTPVTIGFDWKMRSIISNGIESESIIIDEPKIHDYRYAPAIFMPMPMETPTWKSIKETDWKVYVKHLLF